MSSETNEYKREKVSQRFAGDIYEEAKPVANFMAISGVFAGAVGILLTWFVPLLGFILGIYALVGATQGIMYSKYRGHGRMVSGNRYDSGICFRGPRNLFSIVSNRVS